MTREKTAGNALPSQSSAPPCEGGGPRRPATCETMIFIAEIRDGVSRIVSGPIFSKEQAKVLLVSARHLLSTPATMGRSKTRSSPVFMLVS